MWPRLRLGVAHLWRLDDARPGPTLDPLVLGRRVRQRRLPLGAGLRAREGTGGVGGRSRVKVEGS